MNLQSSGTIKAQSHHLSHNPNSLLLSVSPHPRPATACVLFLLGYFIVGAETMASPTLKRRDRDLAHSTDVHSAGGAQHSTSLRDSAPSARGAAMDTTVEPVAVQPRWQRFLPWSQW
jgi:hypothetical protein